MKRIIPPSVFLTRLCNFFIFPRPRRSHPNRSPHWIACCRPIRSLPSIPYVRLNQYPSLNGTLIPGHIRFLCSTPDCSLPPRRIPMPLQTRSRCRPVEHSTRYLVRLGCLWKRPAPDSL